MKFGQSPEEQELAGGIVDAMAGGMADRKAGKPILIDKDGVPVYRILLYGLWWSKNNFSAYSARDGKRRVWMVGRDGKRTWNAVLHDDRDGSPHVIARGLPTMAAARLACENAARRIKWTEGAPV